MSILKPKNKSQTLVIWIAALFLALVLAAVGSIIEQPTDLPINWRLVFNDIGKTLIALSPAFAAGIGLPRLGGENRAMLIDKLGPQKAEDVLETAVSVDQGIDYDKLIDRLNLDRLAERILERNKTLNVQ